MDASTNLFSSANRNTFSGSPEEATSRRISSLFAAVREHRVRTGRRWVGMRRPDDALHRHARGLYERP
jgi:hypothetical protein